MTVINEHEAARRLRSLANERIEADLAREVASAAIPQAVAEARAAGMTIDAIAKELMVSKQGLYYILKSEG